MLEIGRDFPSPQTTARALLRKVEPEVLERLSHPSMMPRGLTPSAIQLRRDPRAQYMTAQTASTRRPASVAARQVYRLHTCSCSDDAKTYAQTTDSFLPRAVNLGNALPSLSQRDTCWDPLEYLLTSCSSCAFRFS